jgi:hypothetical protein
MNRMYRRFMAGVKLVFGLQRPERNLEVFDDDVFIVSYPKSGNTWTRFIIANLLHPEAPANFGNINEIIPDPYALSKRRLARMRRPRLIKSHEYFDPRYKRMIYIVRDPRDVALSQYHFHRKRKVIEDSFPVEQFVNRFISGATSPFGSWGENAASWLTTRGRDSSFLLVRYEDMLQNTTAELARIAAFLHIDAGAERLMQAAERSSAENMRKLENSQAYMWSSTKDTRQDIPFVRTAKSGNWKSDLPEACVVQIESAWGHLMSYLGYSPASPASSAGNSAALELVRLGEPVG